MKIPFLALATILFLPEIAEAEMRYGSFVYDERSSSVLYLTGEITQGDSFELRKALRDHDIRLVVMGSAGGNLYEGLQMGSILHDRGISTYVPPGVSCESSCANMFFGGANRKSDGNLGVHQFYSNNADRQVVLGQVEASAQYTMADIIGIMNEFSTPPFVFEKMLDTTEIYYFTEAELRRLHLNADNPDFVYLQSEVRTLISENPSLIERPYPSTTAQASEALAPQEPAPSISNPPNSGVVEKWANTDFFGADLLPKGVRGVSLEQCESMCRGDINCAAWSYVHATRWCWPKSGVTNLSYGEGITSGIVDWNRIDTSIFDRNFLEVTATDLPGNDLLPRGMPNTTLDECRSACQASSSCLAFTWIAKKNICFPKFSAGQAQKYMGAISGIKQ